jgi:hypothetical protein
VILRKSRWCFRKKDLVWKATANSQSGIYISMAVPVCKVVKVPYGENFVKIFAELFLAVSQLAQPLDSGGPRWFSVLRDEQEATVFGR